MSDTVLKRLGARLRHLRQAQGISQEGLADLAGLHRTYIGGVERGERNISFINLLALGEALGISLSTLVDGVDDDDVPRRPPPQGPQCNVTDDVRHGAVIHQDILVKLGLSTTVVCEAIQYTHRVLDLIDTGLVETSGDRLASLIELANLSAIVGNLFRSGVAKASGGAFEANSPHTFPDLLAVNPDGLDIEIKVALENNNPKGHLVKPGPHITVRYVLANEKGQYKRGNSNRGDVPWIWEVRVGMLEEDHFNFSNTEGDSGKTAVINALGMTTLVPVFVDLAKCPYSAKGQIYSRLTAAHIGNVVQEGHSRN